MFSRFLCDQHCQVLCVLSVLVTCIGASLLFSWCNSIAVQKKETARFSSSALEKNKKAKKSGKFGVHASKGAILIEEEHESINGTKDIPKAVLESSNAGLHPPLLRSPVPKEKSHHESISVATPEAGMDVKQRT